MYEVGADDGGGGADVGDGSGDDNDGGAGDGDSADVDAGGDVGKCCGVGDDGCMVMVVW